MLFEAVTPAHRSFPIGGDPLEYLIGVSPEIMAHWNHRRINKSYAGTSSECAQIKEEHKQEEHAAFQLHKTVKPQLVIRISLCRTTQRNPNDRLGIKVLLA